ncbi:hypothetical protein ACIO8G_28785 [Streptomyces sp. NPDC087219]|uniref:hypothetical protein n=1 Tax=Streptomyces sp. NPDC087219 TaxID=3365770 RepID=UPI0038006F7C
MRTAARTGLVAVATALVGAVAAAPSGARAAGRPADVRAVVSADAGAAAPVGVPAAAPADAPASWTAAPAAGRPYAYLEGPAGSVLQDTLSLTNPGARPLTVRLSGQGAPVSFAAPTVTVPARTRADVPFAVTVTADTPPGEHRGTVRASAAGREVRVDLRLRVSGPRIAALTVEDVHVDTTTGVLRYTLVNRGTTVLAPHLAVRADGVLGTVLDRPGRPLPLTLKPGQRATRTEAWPDPPALDAVTVRLTATAEGAAPATARAQASFASGPALAGAAGLLLLAAGGGGFAVRRRGRSRTQRASAGVTT